MTVKIPLEGGPVDAEIARHAPAARRVRLELGGLRGDPLLARRLESHFERAPWVVEARADVVSGRLLIRYDQQVAFSAALLGDGASGRPVDHQETADRPRPPAGWTGSTVVRAIEAAVGPALDRLLRRLEHRESRAGFPPSPPAPRGPVVSWHASSVDESLVRLDTGHQGLSAREVQDRLLRFGPNAAVVVAPRTRWEVLASQLANLPTGLLLGSAAVSLMLGDLIDAGAIVLVVGLNTAIGYRIERKNEALLASWRRLEAGEARVIRGGNVVLVSATQLVPGDVVLFRAGDVVPADLRVIDAHRLACDESALTGESEPQQKAATAVASTAVLAERASMMYAGTLVASGRGRAVVVATGRDTELAAVRGLIDSAREPETPLEQRLAQLGRWATGIGVGAAGLMAAGSLLRGRPAAAVMRSAVALGVAAIPEGLTVTATAALVNCMNRMRRNGMVVRRLASAETLGGVTVVCVDKTGTLTRNEMQLEILALDGAELRPHALQARLDDVLGHRPSLALAAAVLNSDIDVYDGGNGLAITGSSTERALVTAAQRAGLEVEALRRRFPRRALRERQEGVHYVLSQHDGPDGPLAFVKGAPEQVLPLCSADEHGPLDEEGRGRWLRRNQALAEGGHRVLAVAWRRGPLDGKAAPAPDFDFLGLMALRDPLRPGSAEAVATAARAGIRTLVLTGDQRATAAAVAREVGLEGDAVDGHELAHRLEMNDAEALAQLDRIAVLSRVSPADKVAIVRALRRRGEIVAMAGDGINDAPALKVADVGIAVGANASDIARQTADVVLENADLRSILAAVGEGRIVQDNLRRSVRFLFASNLSEIVLVLGGLLARHEPLSSLQLLWINLLTDTLPGLALALEPGEPTVLARKPAPPGEPLLSRGDWGTVVRDGALMGGLGALGFLGGGSAGAFATLTAAQLGYAVACRSREKEVGRRFVGLVGSAVGLQAMALLAPPLRAALRLQGPVGLPVLGMLIGLMAPPAIRAVAGSVSQDATFHAAKLAKSSVH